MSTTVFRVQKNKEFVVMNNQFLRNREMSLKAKGLLAMCLALPDTWNYSINGLVAICKESQTAIRSTLKELEKHGHLQRIRRKDDKGQFYYEYILHETPYEGFVYTEKQHAQKQHTESANTENNRQINIKEKNIKKINNKEYNINNYIELLDTIPNNRLRNLYCDFLDNRARMKDPLTIKGFELLIERVRELAGLSEEKQIELVRNAVINNWKNVYPRGEEPNKSEEYDKLKNFYLMDE